MTLDIGFLPVSNHQMTTNTALRLLVKCGSADVTVRVSLWLECYIRIIPIVLHCSLYLAAYLMRCMSYDIYIVLKFLVSFCAVWWLALSLVVVLFYQADALATIRTRKFLTNRLLNRKQMVISSYLVSATEIYKLICRWLSSIYFAICIKADRMLLLLNWAFLCVIAVDLSRICSMYMVWCKGRMWLYSKL